MVRVFQIYCYAFWAICLFLGAKAHAVEACRDYFAAFSSQGTRKITLVKEGAEWIRAQERKFFLSAIADVDAAVAVNSKVLTVPPHDVEVRFEEIGRRYGHLMFEEHAEIRAPYQYYTELAPNKKTERLEKVLRHPKYGRVIMMHEYGHSIFHHNFALRDPQYAKIQKLQRENVSLGERDVELTAKLKRLKDMGDNIELQEKLKVAVELKAVKKRRADLMGLLQNNEMNRYMLSLGMFDEFFADFTAVLAAKDPRAVFQADNFWREKQLQRATDKVGSKTFDEMIYRDFSNPKNEINTWKETYNIHAALAPTRHFLYENYLRYPIYMSGVKKQELVDKVFLAAVEAFREVQKLEMRLTPTEVNRIFINRIQKRMKANP